MPYSKNQAVCSLFRLAYFIWSCTLMVPPFIFWCDGSFLFSSLKYCCSLSLQLLPLHNLTNCALLNLQHLQLVFFFILNDLSPLLNCKFHGGTNGIYPSTIALQCLSQSWTNHKNLDFFKEKLTLFYLHSIKTLVDSIEILFRMQIHWYDFWF